MRTIKFYTSKDDAIVLDKTKSITEKMSLLGRSESSIYMRKSYLRKRAKIKRMKVNKELKSISSGLILEVNGIKLDISDVKSVSIKNNKISVES